MLPSSMIGQRIGRYVIRRQLAEGGMGAVYLTTHERLENTQKVVKILLPVYAQNPMLRERFEREALAVSRLRHDHIVTIDDYGHLPDGQLFLMMPFLEGRPLDAYLAQGRRLTEHRALQIAVQICSALQYMHDRGLVHRDIKPSNIFIGQTDENAYHVTLIDLGIAKSLADRDGATHPGAQMGTPAYMPVEQYENAGDVTSLADLCAVAIVIWEMVAGSLPWGMHNAPVLYTKQKTERPVRPPVMSEAFWTILSTGLSPHPQDRQQSMRELANALANEVRAIPPHVPSGAEILAKYAKSLLQHAPMDAETVRNAPNQNPERVAPILWPYRETHAPLSAPVESAPNNAGAGPCLTQPLPTTLSASSSVTTLGLSTVVLPPHAPAVGRRKLSFVGLVAVLIAGLGVFALVGGRGNGGSTQPVMTVQPGTAVQPATTTQPSLTTQPAATVQHPVAAQATAPVPDSGIPAAKPKPPTAHPQPGSGVAPARTRTHALNVVPEVPGQGSNDHQFDPNAVGGQEE